MIGLLWADDGCQTLQELVNTSESQAVEGVLLCMGLPNLYPWTVDVSSLLAASRVDLAVTCGSFAAVMVVAARVLGVIHVILKRNAEKTAYCLGYAGVLTALDVTLKTEVVVMPWGSPLQPPPLTQLAGEQVAPVSGRRVHS